MTDFRFKNRAEVYGWIEAEGGIIEAIEHGCPVDELPEGDTELADAWAELTDAYYELSPLIAAVWALLPEPTDEDFE